MFSVTKLRSMAGGVANPPIIESLAARETIVHDDQARAAAPRRERLEPREPLHRLDRRRPVRRRARARRAPRASCCKTDGYTFDLAFTSVLKRAIRTLWLALDEMDLHVAAGRAHWRLNERHYGALQGLNKAETAAKFGEEQVQDLAPQLRHPAAAARAGRPALPRRRPALRRPAPGELPADRVPQGHRRALPALLARDASPRRCTAGKRVLIAAHGNSLRALVKYLDGISDEDIVELEHPHRHPAGLRARRRAASRIRHYYLGDPGAIAAKR